MKKICVLSGAGISAESGIRTFRDSDGLWEEHDIMDVASPLGWERNKKLVLDFYNQRRKSVQLAKPNTAHYALVELEEKFEVTIITQNIDDLHERAGSSKVIHLHGEIFKSKSSIDHSLVYNCPGNLRPGDLCEKGSQLRPHVVWFGEPVPLFEDAASVVSSTDILIIIGTSMVVYPAAGLLDFAPPHAMIFNVNPDVPPSVNQGIVFIADKASSGVPELVKTLLRGEECR